MNPARSRTIPEPFKSAASEAVEKLKACYPLNCVILFGSVARGEEKNGSDLDLFVVTDGLPEHPLERRTQLFQAIKNVVANYKIDILPIGKTPEETYSYFDPLYFDLFADGIILYDREDFAKNLLAKIGQKIEEQGWIRYQVPDGSYGWRLKRKIKWGERIKVEF
ncbi:MAG: nucleotidyltransferase domain-containing protein [candidate division KSB1 bacterium]|nr:nucleotidyltransferase domain-containing protein [candidate division KSB1 bacterium]